MERSAEQSRILRLRIRLAVLTLAFAVGVGIAVYPFVCNFFYQQRANKQLEELTAAVDKGDAAAYEAEIASAEEYNQLLVGQTVPDVFAIREGTTDETYEGFLNVLGDNVMGSIEIPVIGVNLPIYHYSTEESLLKGCGHIFGSSLPVGGDNSHAVITAHRGLPAAKLFTDLDQVEIGDRFYLKVLDRTLAYEVDNIEVVEPSETRSLAIQPGEDLVTLVTCTPYGVNTDRLLVRGHRVPYNGPEEVQAVVPHASRLLAILKELACVVVGAGLALGLRMLWARAGVGRQTDVVRRSYARLTRHEAEEQTSSGNTNSAAGYRPTGHHTASRHGKHGSGPFYD